MCWNNAGMHEHIGVVWTLGVANQCVILLEAYSTKRSSCQILLGWPTVYWLFLENGYRPISQGRPEIKCLLQGRMSGKGCLLAKPSGPLDTSLTWRILYWAIWPIWRVWHKFQDRNLAGSRALPTISGRCLGARDSDPPCLTKFPGMVHCPTRHWTMEHHRFTTLSKWWKQKGVWKIGWKATFLGKNIQSLSLAGPLSNQNCILQDCFS